MTVEGSGEDEGRFQTSYVDLVQLQAGDAAAALTAVSHFTPFDPALRDELLSAIASRMAE